MTSIEALTARAGATAGRHVAPALPIAPAPNGTLQAGQQSKALMRRWPGFTVYWNRTPPAWATAANALLAAAAAAHAAGGPGLQAAPLYLPAVFLAGLWGGTGPGLAMALAALLAENLMASLQPVAEPLPLAYANDLLFLAVAVVLALLGAGLRRAGQRDRRAAETGQALLRFTRSTGDPTQLPFLLKALVDVGPSLLGCDCGIAFTWQETERRFAAEQQTSGAGQPLSEVTLPTGQPPLSRLLTERREVFLSEATIEGRSLLAAARLRSLRRALCVPAVSWGRVVGCLLFGDRHSARPFTAEEIEVASTLAAQMAVALENAASFQALLDRASEVARLLQLSNALNSQLDLAPILREVAEDAAAIAHARAAAVGLVEGEEVVFRETWTAGRWQAAPRRRALPEVLAADGGESPTRLGEPAPATRPATARAPGCLTLLIRDPRGEPLGALELYERPGGTLSASAERLLRVFANQAAIAIQNGRLYESLRRQHARLKELEKLREDLTHMIVHDLRTPLTGILGSLQTVESGILGDVPREVAEVNRLALRSAGTLLNMVNDLLDIGKLESGKMRLDRVATAPDALIADAVRQVEPLVRERGLDLRVTAAPELPAVDVDPDLAVRVLVNLLGNAIKFTAREGEIEVGARPMGKFVAFNVRDTGEGIPPESQNTIFEKFGQVETSKSGRRLSTGLGLTFCKMAVEAHGGSIQVASEPGVGSTFTVTLPVHAPITAAPRVDAGVLA
jgi:signal transduction histidine kinase